MGDLKTKKEKTILEPILAIVIEDIKQVIFQVKFYLISKQRPAALMYVLKRCLTTSNFFLRLICDS